MAILEGDFDGSDRDYCTAVRDFKRQMPLDVDRVAVEAYYGGGSVGRSSIQPAVFASAAAPH
jgi:hypothetical protein